MFSDRPYRFLAVLSAATLAAVALAGCSSGGGSSASSAGGKAQAPAASAGEGSGFAGGSAAQSHPGAPDSAKRDSAGKPVTGGSSGVVDPASLLANQDQLARRATMALQVKNIGQAVAKVRATAAAAQGIVLAESVGTADGGVPLAESATVTATTYGEITISVPSSKLDSVISDLSEIGRVIRSGSSSENVGSQIVDTASRLDTMRVSVERVRKLLGEAKDLSQIVAIEAELTRRQSDLESLEAQLAALKGSVAQSPVQVSLTTEPGAIAPAGGDAGGFLAGLKAGWKAFTASTTVALTILGAILPFAVVLVLLVPAVWWAWRRRRGGPSTRVAPEQPVSAG
ncbi:DUF4349 domain-containing protein [Pedococcus sp. 5OH_020]|uniref:DUF4349 domain-containing protein n=1 Tax=Pedococcus sp. 5OH_020 TaxID=2989814 RepID=UPI0022EA0294|nr:DUF4349 domain-containing protein [Pedococcus sp. 5OH_020]